MIDGYICNRSGESFGRTLRTELAEVFPGINYVAKIEQCSDLGYPVNYLILSPIIDGS